MAVDNASDIFNRMGQDISVRIFRLLDDPADLARAAAVTRSCRRFAIDNTLFKNLCLRICPEVASFTDVVDDSRSAAPPSADELKWEHRIWSNLSATLVSKNKSSFDCINLCICASSTHNFPEQTIENTREPRDEVDLVPSYWSSGGSDNPDEPASLIYSLCSSLCVIDEIQLKPFKANSEAGHPIYSCKMVRILMGHSKGNPWFVADEDENLTAIADENYVWTYTSPKFPMTQENVLQPFKFHRPVLCIGGVVKIELLGRIEKKDTDGRYYICVSHAKVIGRSLSPEFMVSDSDYRILKYCREKGPKTSVHKK